MTLLDSNLLIALLVGDHEHHDAAVRWWRRQESIATCSITEGALVRFTVRMGLPGGDSLRLLDDLRSMQGHEFLADDVAISEVTLVGVRGHRQVTDAHLAELAARWGRPLATFDRGIAGLRPEQVALVPS